MTRPEAGRRSATLALALLVLGSLVAGAARRGALAADALVAEFKRAWGDTVAIEKPEERAKAQLAALAKLDPASSVEAAQALVAVAIDARTHWKAHAAALDSLAKKQEKPVLEWERKALASDSDARVRCILCTIFGRTGDDTALVPLLKDKLPVVVAAAADALSGVKKKDVVAALVAAIGGVKDARSREDISAALRKLTGKDFSDPVQWTSWWQAEQEKFSFDAPADDAGGPKPDAGATPGGAVPRTTSDGSGLYERVTSEHVCFVIDISGSMKVTGEVVEEEKPESGGTPGTHAREKPGSAVGNQKKKVCSRLEYVQKELVRVIDRQLSKKSTFNVIAFATDVVRWKSKLVPASDSNRRAAKDWVMALKPTSETNIYDALEAAFADPTVDTIYLLTDGFPDYGKYIAPDSICGEVKKWNDTRKVRIHCICYLVGEGAPFHVTDNKSMSKFFMKKLAEETGGTFKFFE